MAITLRGSAHPLASGTTASSVNVSSTSIANSATNDVIVILWYVDQNNISVTPPTGWTLVDNSNNASGPFNFRTYWHAYTGSEPANWGWTFGSSIFVDYMLISFIGCNTSSQPDAHNVQNSATASSLTYNGADALITLGINFGGGNMAVSGYTTDQAGDGLYIGHQIATSAGSTGSLSFTGGSGATTTSIIALSPAGAGGTSWNQSVSDSHSGLDILAKSATKPLGDAHSALDTLLKQWKHTIGEGTSGLDVLLKSVQKAAITENISETDAWVRMRGALQLVLETFSEKDSLTRSFAKSPADAHSGQDTTLKAVTHLLGDAISQVDALAKLPAKRFIDLFSEVDSATATRQAGGVAWSRNITDAHSALDLVVRNASKLTTDQWSSVDAVTRIWVAHLLITEVFSSVDALTKQVTHQTVDTESSRDSVQTMRGALLTIIDALSEQDVQQKLMQHVLSESTSGQDATIKLVRHVVADALSETDRVTAGRSLLLTILEAISQQDGVQPSLLTSSGRKTLAMVTSMIATSLGINIVLIAPPLGTTLSASTALGSTGTVLPPQLGTAISTNGLLSSTTSIL